MMSKLFKFVILLKFIILVHTFNDVDTLNLQGGFSIFGAQQDDSLGSYLSSGDFNGDGIRDIIIGASTGDYQSRVKPGIAYVIMGKTSGLSNIDLATDWTSNQGFRIIGEANTKLGISVSSIGDINGDGADDIIVGASQAGPLSRINAGAAYVIFGQRNTYTDVDVGTDLVATGRGFKIFGANSMNFLGTSVSGLGDINGDGKNDVIVGAPRFNPNSTRTNAGAAYVIFGQSSFGDIDVNTSISASGKGITIYGDAAYDSFGSCVSSAGDINNDGKKDILIGAFYADPDLPRSNAGKVYVIFGGSNMHDIDLAISGSLNGIGFTISGPEANAKIGKALSSGDVNGDGISDLILGADGANSGAGVAYIIFGKSGITDIDLITSLTSSQGITISGVAGNFGIAVSALGDVNGDGIGDFIISATYVNAMGRTEGGVAYIIFGRTSGAAFLNMNTFNTSLGYTINGATGYEHMGSSVANVGDMNQDGINDIILGASEGTPDSARSFAGKVHVIFLPCGAGENKILNNQCYAGCPSGSFSLSGAFCGACATGCSTCTSSGATCTSCDSSHNLYNGLCNTTCPTGYPKVFNRVCYASCPAGSYPSSGNQCIACETGCLSCPGSGATCTLCDTGYNKLYNGTCYASCPAGTYSTSGTGCSPCETGCLSCSGSGPTCTLCNSSSIYTDLIGGICIPSNKNSNSGNGCSSRCPNCLDYYFPQEGICSSKCQYPYLVTSPFVCELPLLSSDEIATIKSTSTAIDIANQMTRITTTIAVPIAAYDPWFMMFISSTQLLFYVRYMEIGFSPQLQKVFQAKKDPVLSLQIDSDPNDINPLPLKFKQYLVPPRFLVNFWQPTLILIIIVSVTLLVGFLKKLVAKNIRLHSMLEKIHLTLKWNYFLTNFTSYYHLLVLYTSVELRTLKLDSFVQVLSLLVCLLINSLGFIIFFHLFRVVRAYKNQSSKVASSSANLSSQENHQNKWQSYEVILKPFKDSLVQQNFVPIWILKTYLFTLVLAYLFDYPLTQGIFLTILSLSMFLYLVITRPVKNNVTQIQYVVMELMFCLVSNCVLILGGLDQADAIAIETREALSNIILYSVLTFTWAGQVFLVVKAIIDLRTLYLEKKAAKKTQIKPENLELKEDQSPLTDDNNIESAKNRINHSPENQDIDKEPISYSSPINSPTSFSESKQIFWKATRLREKDEEIVDIIEIPSNETSPTRPKERKNEDKDHKNVSFDVREPKKFDVSPVDEEDAN